jgi:putative transposase
MARRPRFVVPGVPHHITQRGNNRQDVFSSEQDRIRYLQILREHSRRQNVRILGWCLMSNHVHLVAVPGSVESLALALGQAHSQYSLEQNRKQGRSGHLWQGRFFSCPIESKRLMSAIRYVELNPVRAWMTADACDWRWSSARVHTSPEVRDELLDWEWRGPDRVDGSRAACAATVSCRHRSDTTSPYLRASAGCARRYVRSGRAAAALHATRDPGPRGAGAWT